MDKEEVVHIYNGILLSHKKEQNWAICRDVDKPRDCHTKWVRITIVNTKVKKKTVKIPSKCIISLTYGI